MYLIKFFGFFGVLIAFSTVPSKQVFLSIFGKYTLNGAFNYIFPRFLLVYPIFPFSDPKGELVFDTV